MPLVKRKTGVERQVSGEASVVARTLWDFVGASPWRFWLEGGPEGTVAIAWGRPLWEFRGKNGVGFLRTGRKIRRFSFSDPLPVLREQLRFEKTDDDRGASSFSGGAVGYWGYECLRYFEPSLSRPRNRAHRRPGGDAVPDFIWVMPPCWAVVGPLGSLTFFRQTSAGRMASSSKERNGRRPSVKNRFSSTPPPDLRKNRGAYMAGVRRILEYIAAGDIYQANLSHRLEFPWPAGTDPSVYFHALRRINPSPYAAFLGFPDFSIASCSPELLLRARGRRVETRPIAGTRPRGHNPSADERLSGELVLNAKERAEHIMLVDLERNDLGRVCHPGSVRVSEQMVLEKYSHVMHIVSNVQGRLRSGADALDALQALFPGGTITGCPKIRAMEILDELERVPRGPFFGSAGRISASGDVDLNILIRTALIRRGRLALRVGSGIVADSSPSREYEETLHKARALVNAYRMCNNS